MKTFQEYAQALRNLLGSVVVSVVRKDASNKAIRNFFAMITKQTRSHGSIEQVVDILKHVADQHSEVTKQWLSPEEIEVGRSGDFDALNVRCWIPIAQWAGVDFVPAIPIFNITTEDYGLIHSLDEADIDSALRNSTKAIEYIISKTGEHFYNTGKMSDSLEDISNRKKDIWNRAAEALESLPASHMVRHDRTASTVVKSIAGAGVAGPDVPYAIDPHDMKIGAGWIQRGNRQCIDLLDDRILDVIATGPDLDTQTFVSRPWIAASRFTPLIDDPNRRRTAVQGPGSWPCEWRAFVLNGVVTGVSAYYSFATQAKPLDAMIGIFVRQTAQRMVDSAIAHNLRPAYYITDTLPDAIERSGQSNEWRAYLDMVPPGGFNCCLDFIEGLKDDAPSIMFLESGPPVTWLGAPEGAHPIGFSLTLEEPLVVGSFPKPFGLCLHTPDDMPINGVKAAAKLSPEPYILSWDAADDLARQTQS